MNFQRPSAQCDFVFHFFASCLLYFFFLFFFLRTKYPLFFPVSPGPETERCKSVSHMPQNHCATGMELATLYISMLLFLTSFFSKTKLQILKLIQMGMTDLWVGMLDKQRNGYVNSYLNCECNHHKAENLWRNKLIGQQTKEVPGFGKRQ